jgi:hypothetical protein
MAMKVPISTWVVAASIMGAAASSSVVVLAALAGVLLGLVDARDSEAVVVKARVLVTGSLEVVAITREAE